MTQDTNAFSVTHDINAFGVTQERKKGVINAFNLTQYTNAVRVTQDTNAFGRGGKEERKSEREAEGGDGSRKDGMNREKERGG